MPRKPKISKACTNCKRVSAQLSFYKAAIEILTSLATLKGIDENRPASVDPIESFPDAKRCG